MSRSTRAQVIARRRTVARLRDRLEKRPWVTFGLLAAALAVHLAAGWHDWRMGEVDVWGVVYGTRSQEALERFGGRSTVRVAGGEAWRLLTCGFLHAGPVHLALNGLAMLGLGPVNEAVFGRVRALLVFVVAVLGGAILSQLWGAPLAVGASGGVFGWMGALAAFGQARRGGLHPRLRPLFRERLLPWLVANLVLGLLIPGIDNLGHLGGLLAGAGLGALLGDHLLDHRRPSPARTALLAAGLLVVLSWAGLSLLLALGPVDASAR